MKEKPEADLWDADNPSSLLPMTWVAMAAQTMKERFKIATLTGWGLMKAYEIFRPSLRVLESFKRQMSLITVQVQNLSSQNAYSAALAIDCFRN